MTPGEAYRRLLRRFGPQGWWPISSDSNGRPSYHPGRYGIPSESEALEVALGAILAQNTAWTNVEKAIQSLRRGQALNSRSLASMPRRKLERLIRSSGYFRQKAGRLKDFLRHAASRGGKLTEWLSGSLEDLREDLLKVRGIGPETADSILLYAAARPAFVVDAYTLRIGERVGWFSGFGYDDARTFFTRALPHSSRVYQEFHALFVALAKFYCRTRPLCGACPLKEGCRYGSSH